MKSLKGSPSKVYGHFECSHNKLTTLENSPLKIGGNFLAYRNIITTLNCSLTKVGEIFNAAYNKIKSLDGLPYVMKSIIISDNELESINGIHRIINGFLDCSNNKITSLDDCPDEIDLDFYFNKNPIKIIKKLPKYLDFESDFSKEQINEMIRVSKNKEVIKKKMKFNKY